MLQGRPPRLSQDISTVWAVTACLCLLRRRDLRPLRTPVPQPVPQLTCRTCRSHWSRLFNVEGCTGSENFFANIEEPRPNNPVTRSSSAIGKLTLIGVVHYPFVEKNRSSHFGFVSTSLRPLRTSVPQPVSKLTCRTKAPSPNSKESQKSRRMESAKPTR